MSWINILDKKLEGKTYICGDESSIADIAFWPWYRALILNNAYDAVVFLSVHNYQNIIRWANEIDKVKWVNPFILYTGSA